MIDSKVAIVLTTTPNESEAVRISRALVEEGLAACVQRLPISSTYVWQDKIEDSTEHLLIIKTLAERCAEVEGRIEALSTYEVPEVVAFEALRVAAAYGAWLRSSCRNPQSH
jgi:periplasmic divalent cation tolerance protein